MGNQTGFEENVLNRRKVLAGAAASAGVGITGLGATAALAAKAPAVLFMERSAKKLMKAAQHGSPKSFLNFIKRYTDVGGIALYSLGDYKGGLKKKFHSAYFNGRTRAYTPHVFGSLVQMSFSDIWNSVQYRQFRDDMYDMNKNIAFMAFCFDETETLLIIPLRNFTIHKCRCPIL